MGLTPTDDPVDRWLGPAIAAGVVSGLSMAWWLHWFDFVDLEVYRAGAGGLLHGHDIYDARPPASGLAFTYPPFAAVFFVPLAVLPDVAARVALSTVSIGALVFATWAVLGLTAPGWPSRARWTVTAALCAAALWLEPVRDTLRFGQINLVLMALVLADTASHNERSRWRGVAIGLATAVKLTPGIFILYWVVTRRARQAVTAVATAGLATASAFVLMPSASARYWTQVIFDDRRIGSPGFVWNQSLRGVVARLAGSPQLDRPLWLFLAAAALIAGMALAARSSHEGDELLGVGLAALTGLLISPISWDHHWVWAVPVGIALARWSRAGAAGWAAIFALASMTWWGFAGADDYHLAAVHSVAAACYVLAAIALMAIVAQRGRRSPYAVRDAEWGGFSRPG